MLPSTGYFKAISCPFFDNGLCERPYCHYRHVKKDSQNTANDDIESGAIFQKLVSAAVQKVLQQTETSPTMNLPQTAEDSVEDVSMAKNVQSASKPTYNPTPISQLNKINKTESIDDIADQRRKHIPVPYTPRKPAGVPTMRPNETNGSANSFVFVPPPVKYTPGCSDTAVLDPYTPQGFQESSEKYLPGSETELQPYTPSDTQTSNNRNYIPSDKKSTRKKLLEYKPVKVSSKSKTSSVTYQPTLRSLAPCFSSDEDEPHTKMRIMSSDLNALDDLGPEFDILDQILDDEGYGHNMAIQYNKDIKSEKIKFEATTEKDRVSTDENRKKKGDQSQKEKHTSVKKESTKSQNKIKYLMPDFDIVINKEKLICDTDDKKTEKTKQELSKEKERESRKEHRKKNNAPSKKEKHPCDKKENNKSRDKTKLDKKDETSNKDKHESKLKSSDKKSHKSSSKDKDKEVKQEIPRDKKKHSKSFDRSSRSSDGKSSSSRDVDKQSKHISSSKSDSTKRKDKRHKSSEQSKETNRKRKKEKSLCNDFSDKDSIHNNNAEDEEVLQDNEDESFEMSDPDEEMIALECKRIFEEYVPQEKTTKNMEEMHNTLLDDTSEIEYIPGKKRVSRTMGKDIKVMLKEKIKPNFKVNAAQMMAERLTKIREYHASKTVPDCINSSSITSKPDASKNIPSTPNTGNKIRIAHVPYASTLMSAKKTYTPSPIVKKEQPSTSSTVIQTIKKGAQRVAHMPNEKFIDRPGVLEPLASKIAANIRSTYLNMMIDECLKIYLSATDAYARAQHEELATSKKCSTVQIYKNSAVLTVSRLRKELQECNGIKKSEYNCDALQKIPQTVSGKTGYAGSWSIESKYRQVSDNSREFTGAKFYRNISKWVLTEEQLQDNGFPRPHPSGESGKATIHIQNKNKPPKGFLRTCCRCKKDYTVDKKGFPAVNKECIYHPKNKYRVRGEAKYQCCSQDATSDGCCIAPCHVYEYVDYENLRGYVRTLPPETEMEDYGVYSLDCEMCYTTHGLDLTRVTVINSACKVVYETLIKPLHPIIDYNTRFSGITEEQMAQVTTTLLDVQASLLTMFNSKTILIGHSLESDFKALKFIHDTVVDTSVLYPHKMGPPYKRALRNLCSEYLKKIIQNSVDGHDSAEDATVCMELIIYKLREDLKTR